AVVGINCQALPHGRVVRIVRTRDRDCLRPSIAVTWSRRRACCIIVASVIPPIVLPRNPQAPPDYSDDGEIGKLSATRPVKKDRMVLSPYVPYSILIIPASPIWERHIREEPIIHIVWVIHVVPEPISVKRIYTHSSHAAQLQSIVIARCVSEGIIHNRVIIGEVIPLRTCRSGHLDGGYDAIRENTVCIFMNVVILNASESHHTGRIVQVCDGLGAQS